MEVAYRFDGPANAPVLLLSNSLGTSMAVWQPQVAALSTYFRVLRYDHRGHGASPRSSGSTTLDDLGGDVLGLLDRLGIDRVHIAGLSLGGMVTMWLATHHPERVGRIVLCCTAPYLGPAEMWHARAATARTGGTSALRDTLFSRWFTAGFAQRRADVLAGVAEMLEGVDDEGYAACCEAIAAMDQRQDVSAITAPTLVLGGAADPVAPPVVLADLSQRIPAADLVVLGDAAHLANLEQPARFGDAVLEHLTGSGYARGLATRRSVLGADYVDAALARAGALGAPFQDLVTELAWGAVWARPHLDRLTRRLVTIAMLVPLGRLDELHLHARAALDDGVDPVAIREVLLQSAVYAGVPAANSAFSAVSELLEAAVARRDGAPEMDSDGR